MRNTVVVLFLHMICLTAPPATADQPTPEQIVELLRLVGVDKSFRLYHGASAIAIAKERITAPDMALDAEEEKMYLQPLSEENVSAKLIAGLRDRISNADVARFKTIYESPLYQRAVKEDELFLSKEGRLKFAEFNFELVNEPIKKTRVSAIHKLEAATLSTEGGVYLSAMAEKERTITRLKFFNKYEDDTPQKIEYDAAKFKDAIEHNMRAENLIQMYFKLQNFSDEDIVALTKFFEDPAQREFQALFLDIYANVLREATRTATLAILNHRKRTKT